MLGSVFNSKPFGVSDSLSETIRVSSVGNMELIFQNWFAVSVTRPSKFIDPRVKFGKQEFGSL